LVDAQGTRYGAYRPGREELVGDRRISNTPPQSSAVTREPLGHHHGRPERHPGFLAVGHCNLIAK